MFIKCKFLGLEPAQRIGSVGRQTSLILDWLENALAYSVLHLQRIKKFYKMRHLVEVGLQEVSGDHLMSSQEVLKMRSVIRGL
jgi:hypothetical protein